jgi:hypothetical protein
MSVKDRGESPLQVVKDLKRFAGNLRRAGTHNADPTYAFTHTQRRR